MCARSPERRRCGRTAFARTPSRGHCPAAIRIRDSSNTRSWSATRSSTSNPGWPKTCPETRARCACTSRPTRARSSASSRSRRRQRLLVDLGHVQAVERLLVHELEQLQRLAAVVHPGDGRVALLALATAGGPHAASLLQLAVRNLDFLLRLEVENSTE